MDNQSLKEEIRNHYGKIAEQAGGSCSTGCGCGTDTVEILPEGESSFYTGRDEETVKTADYGLGCGDPIRFSGLREGMTVLDLGSGGGIDVFLAAREVGPSGRSIGLDMTDEMLSRAEENRRKLGVGNAFFVRGEIESIPLPDDSVDHVISNCVINLVPDKMKAFREIRRVLRPGGSFVISDIVTGGAVPDEFRRDPELWAGCVSGAVEKETYLGMIREAGFDEIGLPAEHPVGNPGRLPFGVKSVTVTARKPER